MKKIKQFLFVGFILAIVTMSSCEKDYYTPIPVTLPDTVSFIGQIIPVFDASCNGSGCHNTGGIAPDLTAANAYNDLFTYALVDTTNPEGSILYTRMIASGNPMPPAGLLKGGETDLILKWIQQGALDN